MASESYLTTAPAPAADRATGRGPLVTPAFPSPAPVTPTSPLGGRFGDLALLALRVVAGLMFAQHGAQKLLGWFADPSRAGGGGPPVGSLPWIAGLLELVGGPLLALGLFTRPVAFLLSGLMAVAYFMAHAPQGFWPILNKGELGALYCFVFLLLCAVGPGAYSLDALRRRR
jgi:putative oxidoreductase